MGSDRFLRAKDLGTDGTEGNVRLRVERLADIAALEALTPEWEALDAGLSLRTPFTSPLWNLLWWKHFRAQRPFVRDEFFAHVVRDERGALIAVAPMMTTHRPSQGPLQIRVLQFFGTDTNVTEVRGPACRVEDQTQIVEALSRHFMEQRSRWDWLTWYGLKHRDTTRDWPDHPVPILWERRIPIYYLPLPDSWETFKSGLSRNIKESLRKCYNSLKRDGHSFVLRVVERPQDVPAALDRFFALHGMRADADHTVRHLNVFAPQNATEFLRDYAQHMAERGQLRIFELEIAGKVVATRIGFLLGSELYLYYSGYDLEWGKYSVMTTTVAEAIKWAIEQRLSIVNLSTGNDVSKTRWGPQEDTYCYGVQVSPHWRGRLAYNAYHWLLRQKQMNTGFGKMLARTART
jgi:CelD/BcsL family acetyltransferase involved in cellulose biosynthesis